MQDCYLGVDLGTSGCRAVAIDAAGRQLSIAETALPPTRRTADGGAEQDPDAWWRAVCQVLARIAADLTGTYKPAALCVDATSTTLLLTDATGRPLTPALMYDDQRSTAALTNLAVAAPPECPVHSASSSLAKLLYLRETYGTSRDSLVVHQADWIIGRLSGRFGRSDWNNCLRLGFNPEKECWPEWVEILAADGPQLPYVSAPGMPLGNLSRQASKLTGLPCSTQLCAGTTDSTAAVVATGVKTIGEGVSVLGSTLAVKIVTDRPIFAPEYGVYSHRIGDLWLAGGASNSGGAILKELFSDDEIQSLTNRLRPNQPTGLNYYPLLHPGERFPINDSRHRPAMQPIPEERPQYFQAILEGIADIETLSYQRLRRLGGPVLRRVTSVGGGADNKGWQSIREIKLGVPVTTSKHQAAAYGSAILAWSGTNKC